MRYEDKRGWMYEPNHFCFDVSPEKSLRNVEVFNRNPIPLSVPQELTFVCENLKRDFGVLYTPALHLKWVLLAVKCGKRDNIHRTMRLF